MTSLSSLRRRASRRMIPGDVPKDLEGMLDDPISLLSGPVRKMADGIARHERGKAVVDRKPMFGMPGSPASVRQTSAGGEQSFHLTKNAVSTRSAAEFDSYAARHHEDELAVAQSAGARPAATFDRYVGDHGGKEDAPPALLTTLNPDSGVRAKQWDMIEAFERAQRTHASGGPPRINVRFESDPEFMLEVARRNECPPSLRDLILAERDRVAAGVQLPGRKQKIGVAWIDPTAPATMAWVKGLERSRDRESSGTGEQQDSPPPFKLSAGRATRTVFAADGEFHRLLDADGRRAVLRGLNTFIQAQARAGLPDDAPDVVPLMLAEHVPDRLNHDANYHYHLQQAERLVILGEDGELGFAPTKVAAFTRRDWPKRLRCEFARLSNIELERVGADVRLNPDTHEEMGIEGPTHTKLRGAATVLERAGISTALGLANDLIGWQRVTTQADEDHARSIANIASDHARLTGDVERVRDAVERERLAAEQAKARADEEEAARLRHEAEHIRILIAMARSRAERTAHFAPAYAEKARGADGRDTYDAAGWRRRADQATAALAALDEELAIERSAILERERAAEALESSSTERLRQVSAALADLPRREADVARLIAPSLSPNVWVRIIADTPLLLTQTDNGFVVRSEDDPTGLVAGVDLGGTTNRLRGVQRSQQRELDAVAAYLRKHGEAAVQEDALDDAPPWVRKSIERWRATPAFARLLTDRRRERLLTSAGIVAAALMDDDASNRQTDLPVALAQSPRPLADVEAADLAASGVIVVDVNPAPQAAVGSEPLAVSASPIEAAPPTRAKPRPMVEVTNPPVPARPGVPAWSALELKHRAAIAASDRRDLERLIATRASLDLSHDVGPRVAPDRRKAVHGARIRAGRSLDALGTDLPTLTRHDGLVGSFDDWLIHHAGNNHLGVSHPEIQQRLEVAWRIQREEELGLRAAVWTGEATLDAKIEHHRFADVTTTSVRVIGMPDLQGHAMRRMSDPHFYFTMREAEQRLGDEPDVSRHAIAAVRAWLRAQDEAVATPVIERLRAIACKRSGLSAETLQALAAKPIVAPPVALPPTRARKRRGLPRGLPPQQPGRG